MNASKLFVLPLLAALLIGAQTLSFAKEVSTKDEVTKKTTIKTDSFKKETVYLFPEINYSNIPKKEKLEMLPDYKELDNALIKNPIIYQIQVTVNKEGEKSFKLICAFYSDENNSYKVTSMYDSNGYEIGTNFYYDVASMKAKKEIFVYQGLVKTKKIGYQYDPYISLEVLEKSKNSGMAIKVFTNNKDKYFHIPAYYIQAVLETVK